MLRVSFINKLIVAENLDLIEKYQLTTLDGLNYTNSRLYALPDSFKPSNLLSSDAFDILTLIFYKDFYLIPGVYNILCTNVNHETIPDRSCMN